MKKRVISFILCIVMLVGLLPTATFAATCEHIKSEYYVEVTAPTCYQSGVGKYVCVLCDYTMGTEVIPATNNHYPAGGYVTTDTHHYYKCATPGCTVRLGEEEHTPGRTIADLEPTCGTAGVGHTLCWYCEATIAVDVRIPPTEMHEPDILNPVVDVEPTCSEDGEGHIICIHCGATDKPRWTIPATGQHTAGVWQIVQFATATTPGLKERHCTGCGMVMESEIIPAKQTVSFGDVKKSDFFYKPVQWAVENNITAGTSANAFSPSDPCTRGQIATFLWRAAGKPTPKTSKNPFSDIKKSDYYYTAVLWAVGEGITSGTSKTNFSPNAPCTRGQIAAFLWRAGGSSTPTISKNPFSDVKKKDYYYKAVLWAVENNITAGTTKTTFAPGAPCTRGQIVTFLYRAYN